LIEFDTILICLTILEQDNQIRRWT